MSENIYSASYFFLSLFSLLEEDALDPLGLCSLDLSLAK